MFRRVLLCCGIMFWSLTGGNAYGATNVIDQSALHQIMSNLVVSKKDVTTYKKIFRAIEKEDLDDADDYIEDVHNQILMGHVLAQKYLSKTYKSSYEELKNWLRLYYDHPQAPRILRLAKSKSKKAKEELADIEDLIPKAAISPYSWYNNRYEHLPDNKRKYVRQKVTAFRKAINKGKTLAAKKFCKIKT